ncbi:capsule polysaccharide biosynthesis [Ectothiorhodospira sp. PHS-1]|nr:capsule polysaccharide biosynthesis [Ectothiorhodospira sp. PHS-1]
MVGWGAKASGRRAEALARAHGLQCLRLEDGFLRSYLPGQGSVGLSLVVDAQGIYYDATRPSDLESLLASEGDPLAGMEAEVDRAVDLIRHHRLSKYNHAPDLDPRMLRTTDRARVLVVDQTRGDLSVSLGLADADTFTTMVEAALTENPRATIYIKTHPEVSDGTKRGYLSDWPEHPRVVMLREPVNPISLLEMMDRVYVVTSILGFEALLVGKSVTVLGMPWYAGWGVTDDRRRCARRGRQRSVRALFAAAYLRYTRYLDPETHERGSIFDVIQWLIRQKAVESQVSGRKVVVGLRGWKAANLSPLLSLRPGPLQCVKSAARAERLGLTAEDNVLFWGRDAPAGVDALSQATGARCWHIEDGFIRSVGLGAHRVPPRSVVLDDLGIYFDPSRPSRLEQVLATAAFTEEELARACRVRALIVEQGLTKYNLEPRVVPCWASRPGPVVLVPGQVEDDASIRYGTTAVRTNLGLLQAARRAHPDGFIVYKPHPDVLHARRRGRVDEALQWADVIETRVSVVSCIEHAEVVHTLTSLAGFDALLRGKVVVTYGEPFYAGWGLTQDRVVEGKGLHRRGRRLTLDELVAGVLLRYPRYWDPVLKGYTTCEAVIRQVVAERGALEETGRLLYRPRSRWLRLKYWLFGGLR